MHRACVKIGKHREMKDNKKHIAECEKEREIERVWTINGKPNVWMFTVANGRSGRSEDQNKLEEKQSSNWKYVFSAFFYWQFWYCDDIHAIRLTGGHIEIHRQTHTQPQGRKKDQCSAPIHVIWFLIKTLLFDTFLNDIFPVFVWMWDCVTSVLFLRSNSFLIDLYFPISCV